MSELYGLFGTNNMNLELVGWIHLAASAFQDNATDDCPLWTMRAFDVNTEPGLSRLVDKLYHD